MSGSSTKLMSLERISAITAGHRESGRVVVLANGAFDLLHVGHVRHLTAARNLGDVLVAAVNSDLSVRRLKGAGRPIVPEEERLEILAALSCVDLLVLFHEDTVTEVLQAVRPHIHAKGTDYSPGTVPEHDTVAAWGGRTAICGDPKGHATTDLVSEILRRFGHSQR